MKSKSSINIFNLFSEENRKRAAKAAYYNSIGKKAEKKTVVTGMVVVAKTESAEENKEATGAPVIIDIDAENVVIKDVAVEAAENMEPKAEEAPIVEETAAEAKAEEKVEATVANENLDAKTEEAPAVVAAEAVVVDGPKDDDNYHQESVVVAEAVEEPKQHGQHGFDISKFIDPAKTGKVANTTKPIQQVAAGAPATVVPKYPEGYDTMDHFDKCNAIINMCKEQNLTPPVSVMGGKTIDEKKEELKKNVHFIEGKHKGVHEMEIDALLSVAKSPYLKRKMKELPCVDRPNNPQLYEVEPTEAQLFGAEVQEGEYVFELKLKDKKQRCFVICTTIPEYNTQRQAWTINQRMQTVQIGKKKK